MSGRALALALAAGVLGAPALYAQIIGQQNGILGGEEGFFRPAGAAPPPTAIAIDALPYDRTVACGSYTLTGTSSGAATVEWSVSPGSASGSCSGTDTWSCVVAVSPTSAATATPVVTVTASTSGGSLTDTVTLGFFPGTAYACYLAQSIDGSYNSTVANADAVATWQDMTSGNRDLTQAAGGSQPSARVNVLGAYGQPFVSCDGGDTIAAATAADWTFLSNGTARTVVAGAITRSDNPAANQTVASTKTNSDTARGWRLLTMDSGINDSARLQVGDGAAGILTVNLAADTVPSARFNLITDVVDDDPGDDGALYANDVSSATAAATGAFSSSAGSALTVCDRAGGGGNQFTGFVSHVVAYQRLLTSGEIDAAEAAAEWAYGQTSPIEIPARAVRSDLGITITTGTVSDWALRAVDITGQSLRFCTAGTTCPTLTGSGTTLGVTFDGSNDTLSSTEGPGFAAATGHAIVVATITAVDSNGTGGSCYLNDKIWGSSTANWYGILARNTGSGYKVIGWNNDGSVDCAETDLTLNARAIYEWRHVGGNVGIAVNGGAFVEVASGNTSVTAWAIGSSPVSGTQHIGGTFHEVRNYRAALPATQRAEIIAELKATWGIP